MCFSITSLICQKQSFTDALKNRCSFKFHNIHKKTPVLKSNFNKVAGLNSGNFIKKGTSTQLLSFEYCDIFKNSFFDRTTLVAACDLWAVFSEISFMIGTIKGATNLYFTRYSFVVVIFLIWVYQSLRFLPFILGKYFFIFCCFMCFLTVRSFEFDVIFIEFRHL